MGLTGRKTAYFDKARAEHMERVRAMDDLPAQELNPPEIPEPPQPVSTPKKVRQTWKAKAFDEMTRSTEKAFREGTPAEKKVALQVANAAAGAIASVGGRTQEKWRKQIFNVKTFRGMASKGGSKKKGY